MKHFKIETCSSWRRTHRGGPTSPVLDIITDEPRPHVIPLTAEAAQLVAIHQLDIVSREVIVPNESQPGGLERCFLVPGACLVDGMWKIGYRFIGMVKDGAERLLEALDEMVESRIEAARSHQQSAILFERTEAAIKSGGE